jgi:hypothetical protein
MSKQEPSTEMKSWKKQLGRVAQSILAQNGRTIAVLSIDELSGLNLIIQDLSEILSDSGETVLIADLISGSNNPPSATTGRPHKSLWKQPEPRTPVHFTTPNGAALADIFHNVSKLKASFKNDLQHYSRIVLNLGCATSPSSSGIDFMGPAAAADAIYLICRDGYLHRADLLALTEQFKLHDVKLTGVILVEGAYQQVAPIPHQISSATALKAPTRSAGDAL